MHQYVLKKYRVSILYYKETTYIYIHVYMIVYTYMYITYLSGLISANCTSQETLHEAIYPNALQISREAFALPA